MPLPEVEHLQATLSLSYNPWIHSEKNPTYTCLCEIHMFIYRNHFRRWHIYMYYFYFFHKFTVIICKSNLTHVTSYTFSYNYSPCVTYLLVFEESKDNGIGTRACFGNIFLFTWMSSLKRLMNFHFHDT